LLGDANAIGLADARKLAGRIMFQVAEGGDPVAERAALRRKGSFKELAHDYVERHAKKNNKSWRASEKLVKRYLLPRWGNLAASNITRDDVKTMMVSITAPALANAVLAAASAIFTWAIKEGVIKVNPCSLIERNATKERERVLSDSELPKFWERFGDAGLAGTALKLLLLTGQRPGEVAHIHRKHIVDGWWQMPGKPVPELGWPGTKNGASHRVWLSAPVRALLAELAAGNDDAEGPVFAGADGLPFKQLDASMRGVMGNICAELRAERATPHDLRRTHGSTITRLRFGRPAMNRIQNHIEGGIAGVYDQYEYADENKQIMETVAAKLLALIDGTDKDSHKVLEFARR
jgi:integrase